MDENKNLNQEDSLDENTPKTNDAEQETVEADVVETEVTEEPVDPEETEEPVETPEVEVELVDQNERPAPQEPVPSVLDADITGIEEYVVEDSELQEKKAKLDAEIQEVLKKYKLTMSLLIACIAAYLVFLFVIKESWSTYVVLGICVIMIVLAVYNTRLSRHIQKLAAEKQRLGGTQCPAAAAGSRIGSVDDQLEMMENAQSLNDLPRQYTVLDEVQFEDGKVAQNIVVSPYGVAVVGSDHLRADVASVLLECGIENPNEILFFYDPDQEIGTLAQEITRVNVVCLDERQIMDILLKLTGIRK